MDFQFQPLQDIPTIPRLSAHEKGQVTNLATYFLRKAGMRHGDLATLVFIQKCPHEGAFDANCAILRNMTKLERWTVPLTTRKDNFILFGGNTVNCQYYRTFLILLSFIWQMIKHKIIHQQRILFSCAVDWSHWEWNFRLYNSKLGWTVDSGQATVDRMKVVR